LAFNVLKLRTDVWGLLRDKDMVIDLAHCPENPCWAAVLNPRHTHCWPDGLDMESQWDGRRKVVGGTHLKSRFVLYQVIHFLTCSSPFIL